MTSRILACPWRSGSSRPRAETRLAQTVTVPTTKPGAAAITEASAPRSSRRSRSPAYRASPTARSRRRDHGRNEPTRGDYTTFADGIQAYFNMINSEGGIYGRRLVISAKHDDQFVNDEQTVKASLAQDHAFATFIATALFGGAPDLGASNPPMPTFTWNINQEFAGKPNLFGSMGALCFTCALQLSPYIAQQEHFTRVAVLGYGGIGASKTTRPASRRASRSTRRRRSSTSTPTCRSASPTSAPRSRR